MLTVRAASPFIGKVSADANVDMYGKAHRDALIVGILLLVTIVRPVLRLSSLADQISMGNLEAPELPVSGKDEISILAASFNRMRRSLVQAMKMLGEQ